MSRMQPFLLVLTALLAIASAMMLARLVDRQRAPRLELTEARRLALAQGAGEALQRLGDPVVATYFVTPAAEMPSSMRRVERDVTDALDAIARTSGGLLRHDVLHVRPGRATGTATGGAADGDQIAEKLATRYGARPFPVRTVLRDGHSEQSVHSSLVLASGPRPPVIIDGIAAEQAARLPSLIVAHLERLANPRRPRIALAAPRGHAALRQWLGRLGDVRDVDLDAPGSALPADADLLIWIQPRSIDARRVRQIDLHLEQGRSIIIAASRRAAVTTADGRQGRVEALPWALDGLLDSFGLRAVDGLLLDPPRAEARTPLPQGTAPLYMRNIGADQDFRLMSRHLSASTLFAAPTPIMLAEAGASRDGWSFHPLATTSDASTLVPWPADTFEPSAIAALGLGGEPMPRAPLMTMLRPHDPWSGSLVLIGSAMPLADGIFDREGFGHRKMADVFVESLASPERLIAIDAWTEPAPPLPELAAGERLVWRVASILPLPVLLLAVGLWRRSAGRPMMPKRLPGGANLGPHRGQEQLGRVARTAVPMAAAMVLILGIGVIAAIAGSAGARLGLRADLTEAGSNSIAPETLQIAEAAPSVSAELFATERLRMPPRLRGPAAALESLLRDIEGRVGTFDLRVVRPEALSTDDRARLADQGVRDSSFTDRDEEITVVRRFTCALRLRTEDGRVELLEFPDEASFEHAEFRIAFALLRLTTGQRTKVAVIADRPRPTPAEAHEYFQLQGLQAPMGTDVYALARQTLARHDFEVITLDHREPVVPDDADLLLWLQPRRPGAMLADVLSRSLNAGRPAIVAAQHFNIQARLYPGRDHRVVYWPQPQWPDMQGGWFGVIGATLPRLVLLDELQLAGRGESQVMGRGERSFTAHETSLPFLIRAATGNFDLEWPIMRGVGDQGFVWGSFIALDPAALARRDLRATTLIWTSPRTWTYAWDGGFLPEALIDGPIGAPNGGPTDEAASYEGRLPLAVLLEGRFPIAAEPERDHFDPASLMTATSTRLMLIGGSELFKDTRLRDPNFRGDHFLLNAVTGMGADGRLLQILARRTTQRGLDFVEPDERVRWRVIVVALPAVVLLLLGGGVFVVRRVAPAPMARRLEATTEDVVAPAGPSDGGDADGADGEHDAEARR